MVSGKRQDLIRLWRGEQEGWGNSLSKDTAAGVFLGLVGTEDTALTEYYVCVRKPWEGGRQKKWAAYAAMASKSWQRTWTSQGQFMNHSLARTEAGRKLLPY